MMTSGLGQRLRAAVLSIQLSAYVWLEALLAETLLLFDEPRPATERGIIARFQIISSSSSPLSLLFLCSQLRGSGRKRMATGRGARGGKRIAGVGKYGLAGTEQREREHTHWTKPSTPRPSSSAAEGAVKDISSSESRS